jgi:hypothetical protein
MMRELRAGLVILPGKVAWTGSAALGLLVGVCVLPYVLTRAPDPSEVEERIRHFMRWQVAQQCVAELTTSGRPTPDLATARRWEQRLEAVDEIEFASVQVRRSLLGPPVRRTHEFVARVVVRDEHEQRTRFYWLGRRVPVRECLAVRWHLPL